jgi:hypothetical protein
MHLALLASGGARMRSMAAYNLDLMGTDASFAKPFLEQQLAGPDDDVRRQVEQALRSITGQER